jgi:5'-3' exonuclease
LKKTLIIDGYNLLKIGVKGVKNYYHKDKHIGGIWYFTDTLRKFIQEHDFDKVLVMWDGVDNRSTRKLIYPKYKENRGTDTEQEKENFDYQRHRVKKYLEEMFVRQIEVEQCEADDLIAYYCKIAENEKITIFSSDKDLLQLVSENVTVYSPSRKTFYKKGDKIKLEHIELPLENIKTFKIISGDKSDNIDGIYFLGEKNIAKYFPEMLDSQVFISDILTKAEKIFNEDKEISVIKNLLTGKTRSGIYGEEFFQINEQLVDLSNPLITEHGKEIVEQYYSESLDPDGRGYKNLMKLMMEDGFFKFLPKTDDAWVNFLKPFLKLTRKEKRNYKK